MTIISNARTVTYPTQMTDPGARVLSQDELGIATAGTDFIFDARNPACYAGGALPAVNAQPASAGVIGARITAAGSGGTNGTFALGWTGGSGSGAAGTFTVAGGVLSDISITARGTYTVAPAPTFAASAGLTGAAATAQLGFLLSAARDVQPALSRTKPVGLSAATLASRPAFDGKGLAFTNGATTPMVIEKAGIAPGRVCEPYHEGFVDLLEICVLKIGAFGVANASPYMCTGGGGGFQFSAGGVPASKETGSPLGAALPTGRIITVAKRVRFDSAAGTSTIIGWTADGSSVVQSATLAGKALASYTTGTAGIVCLGAASGSAALAITGVLHYAYRELIGISGRSDGDCLAVIRQVHAAALERFA